MVASFAVKISLTFEMIGDALMTFSREVGLICGTHALPLPLARTTKGLQSVDDGGIKSLKTGEFLLTKES